MLEKRAVEFHLEEDVQGKNGKDNKRVKCAKRKSKQVG